MAVIFHCLQRIVPALVEALELHLAADVEIELEQVDAVAHQHALELRRLAQEVGELVLAAEAHHALDAGAIVPGAVEQHDLAGRRQLRGVALEVPLAAPRSRSAWAVPRRGRGAD